MKKCYGCGLKLPLFAFTRNNGNYQRPSQKGRNFNCRLCVFKHALKNGGYCKRGEKRFEVIKETNKLKLFYDTFWKR